MASGFRLESGAFRLLELGWRTEPEDRRRLMAARAEPLASFSAILVRSSGASSSQQSSHALTSRERPRERRGGGRPPVRVEIGGSVTLGRALWLRCRPRGRTWGRVGADDAGRSRSMGGGLVSLEIISALPSKENDSRTRDERDAGVSDRVDEHDEGGKKSVLGFRVSLHYQNMALKT